MGPLHLFFLQPVLFPPGQLLFHPAQPNSSAITSGEQRLWPSAPSSPVPSYPVICVCLVSVSPLPTGPECPRAGRVWGGLQVRAMGRSLAPSGVGKHLGLCLRLLWG